MKLVNPETIKFRFIHDLPKPTSKKEADCYYATLAILNKFVDELPTMEAEPIVARCKNCVYRSIYPGSDGRYWCNQWEATVSYEEGYCYRGSEE